MYHYKIVPSARLADGQLGKYEIFFYERMKDEIQENKWIDNGGRNEMLFKQKN